MQLHIIDAGTFKLDGGALYGVVPKSMWSKNMPSDENNMCEISMRCLLIEDSSRLVLIDTGIGEKQDDKFLKHFHLSGPTLLQSLKLKGFHASEITDVFFTHLHFDHCGGGTQWQNNQQSIALTFPNAIYWSNQAHWQWAIHPNAREKASFLKENLEPLEMSGQMIFVDPEKPSPFAQFDLLFVDGHTEKQMIPLINYKDKKIVFMADLIPTTNHIPLPWIPSFDTRPLYTLNEKARFLQKAADDNYLLFFEHDAKNECCTVKNTDKGVKVDQVFPLSEIL
ncbi:MAG: MBL fold metallo-hydrolase [Cyclobacteriaceae bacterium]